MRRGFTLLEVLVAVGIFALVSSMSYASLTRALAWRDRLEQERDFWSALSVTLLRLQDDLRQSCPRPVLGPDGRWRAALRGEGPDLELTKRSWTSGDWNQPGLERVAYLLQDGSLWRAAVSVSARSLPERLGPVRLLGGVEEFRLRFYSASGDWMDRWPPAPAEEGGALESLPLGVEMSLRTVRGEFRRRMPLAL